MLWSPLQELGKSRRDVELRHDTHGAVLEKQQRRKPGAADAGGIAQNCLEHWFQVAGRGTNDAQDLRCGFLPLQRLVALTDELSNVRLSFGGGSGWTA